jgi:hypothetical protein
MAKGQGLPLSFIVIAAISVLILVLIVAFTIGGLGSSFKQLTITGQQGDLSTVQTACTANCNKMQATTPTFSQFQSSDYCAKTYAIDLNKNNKIEATSGETGLNCYNSSSIGVDCTVQLENGKSVSGAGGQCKKAPGQKCEFESGGTCINATATPCLGTTVTGLANDCIAPKTTCCVV